MSEASAPVAKIRRGPHPLLTTLLIIATVIAFAPVLCGLLGDALAQAYSCETYDTGARNCSGFGAQIESEISFLMGMAWLMLLTIPLILLTPLLWLIWLWFAWRARRRRVG